MINPTAEITAFYIYAAVARPNMPIAWVNVITQYTGSIDPNTGEYPSSQPVLGQD